MEEGQPRALIVAAALAVVRPLVGRRSSHGRGWRSSSPRVGGGGLRGDRGLSSSGASVTGATVAALLLPAVEAAVDAAEAEPGWLENAVEPELEATLEAKVEDSAEPAAVEPEDEPSQATDFCSSRLTSA